jgi:DME family drug/metabolite transporter
LQDNNLFSHKKTKGNSICDRLVWIDSTVDFALFLSIFSIPKYTSNPGRDRAMNDWKTSSNDGIIGCSLVLTAGLLWGTVGTARSFAPADVSPQAMGVLRLSLAGAALLIMALLRGDLRKLKRFWGPGIWIAAAGMAAYQFFFFASISRTGVAIGTIVAMGSPPVFAGLIEWSLHGERPNMEWVYAAALAVLGCALLISGGGGLSVDAGGVLLALGAGGAFAVFSTAVKKMVADVPAYAGIAAASILGALVLAPFLWFENLGWLIHPEGYTVVLFLGIFATALPYLLYTLGLRRVNAKTATTLTLAEPLTAGLLGVFFLGERLSLIAVFGMALLLVGFVLTSIEAGRVHRAKAEVQPLKSR